MQNLEPASGFILEASNFEAPASVEKGTRKPLQVSHLGFKDLAAWPGISPQSSRSLKCTTEPGSRGTLRTNFLAHVSSSSHSRELKRDICPGTVQREDQCLETHPRAFTCPWHFSPRDQKRWFGFRVYGADRLEISSRGPLNPSTSKPLDPLTPQPLHL